MSITGTPPPPILFIFLLYWHAVIYLLELGSPSCTQATRASTVPQESSHTVPQTLLLQISTRPLLAVPPCSLMAPWVQVTPVHLTPASSKCPQLWLPSALAGQSMSLVSVPRHWTLSNQIWPAPLVKPVVRATAPEVTEETSCNCYPRWLNIGKQEARNTCCLVHCRDPCGSLKRKSWTVVICVVHILWVNQLVKLLKWSLETSKWLLAVVELTSWGIVTSTAQALTSGCYSRPGGMLCISMITPTLSQNFAHQALQIANGHQLECI
jgi:hypothetical protein